ncbi:hypothetical protein PNBC_11130 [Paenibacillus crassostreae]|uniref:Uncharacterized protein n=1 Tax=Paenibacillus crassostreae TaxID=1763538 RepID=A0A167DNN5_9BACL|nr:hypothetical protein LPB68_02830 [Paenibacillus crassostreae]OAB74598.1 hypothetical protein PNBC_11130 [Paenibacillus crassostreae]
MAVIKEHQQVITVKTRKQVNELIELLEKKRRRHRKEMGGVDDNYWSKTTVSVMQRENSYKSMKK